MSVVDVEAIRARAATVRPARTVARWVVVALVATLYAVGWSAGQIVSVAVAVVRHGLAALVVGYRDVRPAVERRGAG